MNNRKRKTQKSHVSSNDSLRGGTRSERVKRKSRSNMNKLEKDQLREIGTYSCDGDFCSVLRTPENEALLETMCGPTRRLTYSKCCASDLATLVKRSSTYCGGSDNEQDSFDDSMLDEVTRPLKNQVLKAFSTDSLLSTHVHLNTSLIHTLMRYHWYEYADLQDFVKIEHADDFAVLVYCVFPEHVYNLGGLEVSYQLVSMIAYKLEFTDDMAQKLRLIFTNYVRRLGDLCDGCRTGT